MKKIIVGELTELSCFSSLVQRITAANPSPLTGAGTNTYIIAGHIVIDPGPVIDSHIEAILKATGGAITHILVTHTHADHSPAAAVLVNKIKEQGRTCELIGSTDIDDGHQDKSFKVARQVEEGDVLNEQGFSIQAIHTPGHVGNHYCYLLTESIKDANGEGGMLFAGDHLMEGSTVVIIPPSGDMADYMASLKKLNDYAIESIAPGHGHLIKQPKVYINDIIEHRLTREKKVLMGLRSVGGTTLKNLTLVVYDDVDSSLHGIAGFSLWAHLLKLEKEKKVKRINPSEVDFTQQAWVSF